MRHARSTFSFLLGMVMLAAAAPVTASTRPAILETARHLAENVLGQGTVQSVRIEAANLLMTWESATYRREHTLPQTRELLYAEAELATGSVMGRLLGVNALHFTIMLKGRGLASGVNTRGQGTTMVFSTELGGGSYTPPPQVPIPGKGKKRPGQQN